MADEPKWWWRRERKQEWAAERQRVAQTLFYEASRTPAQRLLAASKDGDVASVAALLLDGSVDVDAREQDGWLERTPLHVAAINGQRDVVECLLRHGAAVDATSKTMQKPLHQLTRKNIESVTTLLIQASQTDTNPTATGGWTALHWAARCGQAEAVKLLLKAQADPNAADEDGQTPLHVACFVANRDVIRVLLGAGADLDAVTKGGFKPLHHCIRWTDHLRDDALHAMQLLTGGGACWDATCDEMIATGKACEEAPAIRVCISMWARERAEGRPLTDVEIETIRRGRSNVHTYFSERTKSRKAIYRRKICVVGTSKAGKTSLIKSLTTKLPQLEHADDRTIGIDKFHLRLPEPVHGTSATTHEVTFWDFAGQDAYHVAHSLFFSARTLFLVCVDLEAYQTAYMQADLMCDTKAQHEQLMNEFIERIVLRWVRVIFARQPDAEFVFLSTKDDLLRGFPRFTKEIKAFLKVKLSQVQGIVDVMKRQNGQEPAHGDRPAETLTLHAFSKYPRSANKEKAAWSDHSHAGRTQKPSKLNDGTSIFVSCTDVASVAASRQAIEAVVLTSGRSFLMPDSYSLVLNAIIDMREAAARAPARERIAKAFVSVSTLLRSLKLVVVNVNHRDVLQILHDLGDILWYEDLGVELFAETVILDPMLLIDFVRQVINHEVLDELLEHRELVVKPFWRSLADEAQLLAMKQMLEKFQLVHASTGAMEWDSDLIVPAIWKSKQPAAWLFGGEEVRLGSDATADDEDVRVYWEFCFPYEFPDTLFDHLVVASYSPYYTRHAGPDWIVYEEPLVFNCRIMVSRDGKSMQRMLRLEAVLAKGADTEATTELWEIFQLLCMSLRQVLRRYPGLLLTSYALDDTLTKRMRLESLFQFPVSARSRKWMPRADVWEWYKALITHTDS